jgi:hypothetical protein
MIAAISSSMPNTPPSHQPWFRRSANVSGCVGGGCRVVVGREIRQEGVGFTDIGVVFGCQQPERDRQEHEQAAADHEVQWREDGGVQGDSADAFDQFDRQYLLRPDCCGHGQWGAAGEAAVPHEQAHVACGGE